ncbi:hypothetical protein MUY35_04335 [Aliiroseovarius sp. S1339]|uniref:hypothetical protein n=1 Tax=Aliiroseovarius sp. S1339 TaxID=2936990 RepID=UPI0020C055E3|nr:hypothetical protein [Aliiroseovarius sp. S1339]MCK8463075.1 hypothetical protein [Aliiroseovarius sp. S1339]
MTAFFDRYEKWLSQMRFYQRICGKAFFSKLCGLLCRAKNERSSQLESKRGRQQSLIGSKSVATERAGRHNFPMKIPGIDWLKRNGFFLSEVFFGTAGLAFLLIGSDLLIQNAFSNDEVEQKISNNIVPTHPIEDITRRSVFAAEELSVSHIANCAGSTITSELEKVGSGIYLNIQLTGSVSDGCTEHYLYVSSSRKIEMSSRTGDFSQVRVNRLDNAEIEDFGDQLPLAKGWYTGTLVHLSIRKDDFSYWQTPSFTDDEFWGNEKFTNSQNGSIQGRIRIRVHEHVLEWGHPWYLPYFLTPVITKLNLSLPSINGLAFWKSFSDIDYDRFERQPAGFFQKSKSFDYPELESLDEFFIANEVRSRIRVDHPVRAASRLDTELVDGTLAEIRRAWPQNTSLKDVSGSRGRSMEMLLMPRNFEDRVNSLYVIAGVLLGFGLALLIEVLALILRRLEVRIAQKAGKLPPTS